MLKYLFVIIFLLPTIAFAQVYDVQITGEYVMGDSDTKIEARRIALDHAKRLAVENIGTYIETKTEVVNWQLTRDEITTYTSAIVKTSIISENVRLLEDKTTVITININASVDIGALDKKIKEIKDDSKRKEQIKALQAENTKLARELESISALLKQSKESDVSSLRKQREDIFTKIDKNQNTITIAFEKGALLNLAQINKDEFENDKKFIDDCIRYVVDNIKVKLENPQIIDNGDTADLELNIKWSYKFTFSDSTSSRCFEGSEKHPFLYYNYDYVEIFPKGPNAKKLSEYIDRTYGLYKYYIEVKVGNAVERIYLFTEIQRIKVNSSRYLIFRKISKEQLADISSVDAKIVTSDEPISSKSQIQKKKK